MSNDNKLPSRVAVWLHEQRTIAAISQRTLAAMSDTHDTTLSTIERDHRDVRLSTFVKLCRALGSNPATVLAKLLK